MSISGIERDSGLQRERTALAWTRSALVFTTCMLMIVRFGIMSVLQLAFLVFVFWLFLNVFQKRRQEIFLQIHVVNEATLIRNAGLSLVVSLSGLMVAVL